jgi:MFS family permease
MLTTKRVLVTTVCGFIFGLICMTLASSNPNPIEPVTATTKWLIILSRTMMGFMIGISALRLSWWLHGILIGFIASIPMAIPVLTVGGIAIGTVVMGIIYGFLTELIASKLFKVKPVGTIGETSNSSQ